MCLFDFTKPHKKRFRPILTLRKLVRPPGGPHKNTTDWPPPRFSGPRIIKPGPQNRLQKLHNDPASLYLWHNKFKQRTYRSFRSLTELWSLLVGLNGTTLGCLRFRPHKLATIRCKKSSSRMNIFASASSLDWPSKSVRCLIEYQIE